MNLCVFSKVTTYNLDHSAMAMAMVLEDQVIAPLTYSYVVPKQFHLM